MGDLDPIGALLAHTCHDANLTLTAHRNKTVAQPASNGAAGSRPVFFSSFRSDTSSVRPTEYIQGANVVELAYQLVSSDRLVGKWFCVLQLSLRGTKLLTACSPCLQTSPTCSRLEALLTFTSMGATFPHSVRCARR